MSNSRDFVEDLLVRSRRGALSEDENAELRDALSTSTEARLLLAAGLGFDAEGTVEAGDDELIRRMARRAQKPVARAPQTRLRYFVQGALAGALLTGVAVAGVQAIRDHFNAQQAITSPPLVSDTAPPTVPAPTVRSAPAELVAPAPAEPVDDTTPSTVPSAANEGRPALHAHATTAVERAAESAGIGSAQPTTLDFADAAPAPPSSAAELFGAGNRARVRGDVAAAIALYRQLESRYPNSAEANSARLSLGVLYLQQHQAAAALSELQKRSGSSGGAADAEALWGQAEALRELGRVNDERSALEKLVAAYPSSAYVTAARRRLVELH